MEENAKIEAKRNALKAINENKSPSFATRLFAKKRNSKGPMTPNSLTQLILGIRHTKTT